MEVVGFPFYKEDVLEYVEPLPYEKKTKILISGRPEQSNLKLRDKIMERSLDEVEFLQANSRREYYELLNQAKIVISVKTEETFGITPLEAFVLGAIPLCPNRCAYLETIEDERLLYSNEKDLMDKLAYLLALKENPFQIDIEPYRHTIAKCMKFVN